MYQQQAQDPPRNQMETSALEQELMEASMQIGPEELQQRAPVNDPDLASFLIGRACVDPILTNYCRNSKIMPKQILFGTLVFFTNYIQVYPSQKSPPPFFCHCFVAVYAIYALQCILLAPFLPPSC